MTQDERGASLSEFSQLPERDQHTFFFAPLVMMEVEELYWSEGKLGLQWEECRDTPLSGGRIELDHDKLAEALQTKSTFTPHEWEGFGVSGLHARHFIRSADKYFQPSECIELVANAILSTARDAGIESRITRRKTMVIELVRRFADNMRSKVSRRAC